jgi:hypothetical protein
MKERKLLLERERETLRQAHEANRKKRAVPNARIASDSVQSILPGGTYRSGGQFNSRAGPRSLHQPHDYRAPPRTDRSIQCARAGINLLIRPPSHRAGIALDKEFSIAYTWECHTKPRGSGAVVAQLLPKQWVAGSNPVSRSIHESI